MAGKLNGNFRLLLAVIIPLLVVAFGYGTLSNRVTSNEMTVVRIEAKIDRLIESHMEQP